MAKKLRGQGPKTFISYGFGNTLAPRVAEYLEAEGFQVTLIVDTMLLGEPSLADALERHIGAAEVVVPVLDTKANQSVWVMREVETALARGRLLLPVVQDSDTLPDRVRDIPYLSEHNFHALVPTALKRFALLPLDPEKPYLLREDALREFLFGGREVRRVILDSDDVTGQLLDRIPAVLDRTKAEPHVRRAVETQVRDTLNLAVRLMDRAQPGLVLFRRLVDAGLAGFGPRQKTERTEATWQRLARLLAGVELLDAAVTFPPEWNQDFWVGAAPGMAACYAAARRADTPFWSSEQEAAWALTHRGDEGENGWTEVALDASVQSDFRGYFPTTADITEMVNSHLRPTGYVDESVWAEFGLPQLVARAVHYRVEALDNTWIDKAGWSLADYEYSGRP